MTSSGDLWGSWAPSTSYQPETADGAEVFRARTDDGTADAAPVLQPSEEQSQGDTTPAGGWQALQQPQQQWTSTWENGGSHQSTGDWRSQRWGGRTAGGAEGSWGDEHGRAEDGYVEANAGQRRDSDASGSTAPSSRPASGHEWWQGPWTPEDWDRWNAWWHAPDGGQRPSTWARPSWSSTTRTDTPSSTRPGSAPTTSESRLDGGWPTPESRGPNGGKGPSERLIIPSFTGEGDGSELGNSARSYLRQVAAWERMTKLAPDQRALVLYQHLQGSAWISAESLNVESLASDHGVQYLRSWIEQHYLDVEVTLVGRSLSDLFRKLRRKPSQSFRDYVAEFNRLLARVVECGCTLPDVATAWLFVDRANIDEATEVSLLASVGNKYALRALQSAAIILDRSMRKPWEKFTSNRKTHTVNQTDATEPDDDEESDLEPPDGDFHSDDEDLYVTYMTAKARYKDVAKARGVESSDPQGAKKKAEERIQAAKNRSHCSACGQRGHWHRDTACPKNRAEKTGGDTAKDSRVQTIHVTNEIHELTAVNLASLPAVLDSACSKTVVGTGWLQRYLDYIKGKGIDIGFIYEKDAFRFGAAHKIYEANYSAVILMVIGDRWIAIKAAVIHGEIPLLVSRPALAKLGLLLDLGNNTADFRAIGSGPIELMATASGHPSICVDHRGLAKPDISRLPTNWESHGVVTLSAREVYMVGRAFLDAGCSDLNLQQGDPPRIFYEKHLDPAVKNILVADSLNPDTFLGWWRQTSLRADFWIETPITLVRVHIVPRRMFFDPRKWRTPQSLQKEALLQALGSVRETWGISCMTHRSLSTVSEMWQAASDGNYPGLWIGRSVFNRASACPSLPVPLPSGHERQGTMEHEQGRADRRMPPAEHPHQLSLDSAGASPCPEPRETRPQDRGQGPRQDDLEGVAGRGDQDGLGIWGKGEQGQPDAADPRCPSSQRDGHDFGQIQRDGVSGCPGELCQLGVRGGACEWGQHAPRPQEVCVVEAPSPSREGEGWSRPGARPQVLGPGGACPDPSTTSQRDGLEFLVDGTQRWRRLSRATDTEDSNDFRSGDFIPTEDYAQGPGRRIAGDQPDAPGYSRGRGPGDPRIGGQAGVPEGSLRGEPRTLSTNPTADAAGDHDTDHNTHHEHHDVFESCSSGDDRDTHDVLLTKHDARYLSEHPDFRAKKQHPGEVAAADAFRRRDFDPATIEKILDFYHLPGSGQSRREVHAGEGNRVIFGYYAYGNFHGVSRRTTRWPDLVRYLNGILSERWTDSGGEEQAPTWTSISLSKDMPSGLHTDKNNLRGSSSFMMTFGDHQGGDLFIEQPGGGTWRRNRRGEEIEGTLLDTKGSLCEFDSLRQHGTEPWQGTRWALTAYTARSFPEATKDERKLLRGLGFQGPDHQALRGMRARCQDKGSKGPGRGPQVSARPGQSRRRALWKTASALSIFFTTALSVMIDAAKDALPCREAPDHALLEVGGISATCRLAEYGGDALRLAEPIILEDLIDNDHSEDSVCGYVETATIRAEPGELWLHVRPEWTDPGIYEDVMEAVDYQLRHGRAVVFQNDDQDGDMWESTIGGWEEAGYRVDQDFERDGTEYVRVIYEHDANEFSPNEVMANEQPPEPGQAAEGGRREGSPTGERGGKAIRFPPSVPSHIASGLRRLHQNLGHPAQPDFTLHLRLAGSKPCRTQGLQDSQM